MYIRLTAGSGDCKAATRTIMLEEKENKFNFWLISGPMSLVFRDDRNWVSWNIFAATVMEAILKIDTTCFIEC